MDELSGFLSLVPAEVHVMPIGLLKSFGERRRSSRVAVKLGRNFSEIEVKDNQVKFAGNLSSKVAISLSELGYDLSFKNNSWNYRGSIGYERPWKLHRDYVQSIRELTDQENYSK